MKRKILGLTLVLCIMTTLLTALPLTVNAASSGKCGTNVNWTLDDNGTLTISGTGSMTIYPSYSSVPWYNSRSSIKTVVIQGGVTSIGIEAFYNCNSLTSITIPDSVTSIGYCAFYGCTGLTSITIPDSVTSIGNYAFQNCSRLTLITISNSVTSIGNYAFLNCSSIASITIPDCVTSIGSGVFSGCYSLKEVYYIGSKEDWSKISISSGNTYLTNATLHYIIANGSCGEKVTWALDDNGALFIIGTGDMANYTSTSNAPWYGYASDIEKVVIRNGVTGIGKYAFFKCSKVTSITIPGSIKSIGYAAFYNCTNLTSITIPASVTSIDGYAFWNCSNIKHVYYIGNEENWNKISIDSSNIPLTNATRHYIIANGSCGNNVNWALDYEGTLTISGTGDMTNYDYMSSPWLSSRSSVKTVVIQDGVTSIGNYAFYYCNNLTSITIPDSVTSIGNSVFGNCKSLTSITIPNSITSIGPDAFFGCGLTSITIPDSVTSIGNWAFEYCSSLTSITIPDSVTSIGSSVFYRCSNLADLTIPFIGQSRQASDANRTLGYLFGSSSYDGSYIVSQNYSQGNSKSFYLPKTLKKVTVTNETSIPYGAFNNCSYIYEIDIKEGPEAIENYAFSGCDFLKKVTVPSSVEAIAQNAFTNSNNIVLYGKEGSYIESFAARNNIPFVATEDEEVSGFDAVLNKIGGYIIVTANVPDDEISKNIHAALYSSKDVLLEYMVYPAEYSNNTVHFMFKDVSDSSYIKVFLWKGFDTMIPLSNSIVLNCN